MNISEKFNERMYPEFLSQDQKEILSNLYSLCADAARIKEYQKEMSTSIPDHKRNDFQDMWRKIESHEKLCVFLTEKFKAFISPTFNP